MKLASLTQYRFFDFLKARENARMHKEAGVVPHSEDPILQHFSFCNINREHDNVTKYIKANVRDNPVILRTGVNNMVLNLAVARVFNSPGTLDEIGHVKPQDLMTRVLKTVQDRQKRKLTIFRGAYMMPSHGSPDQLKQPPAEYYLNACATIAKLDFRNVFTLKEAADLLLSVHGFGPFIVNQVVTDLRYTDFYGCAPDWETFVLGGPGTSRGLCRYYGEPLTIGKSQKWMRPRLEEVRNLTAEHAGKVIARYFLDPNNISNSFCEFDKYERVRDGGALKRLYRPIK
jgi:hypothetical protein